MNRKLKPRSQEDDEASVFSTYDLGVSAALLCLGYKLIRLDRDDPRKALFVFRKDIDIDAYANQYFSDQLKVKARSFFDSIKALKNKLYSE